MSVQRIAAPYRRLPVPFVAAIVAVAFAIGALAGYGLPRVPGSASNVTGISRPGTAVPAFAGVAENNMSDAVLRALNGSAVTARTSAGVAENNMSDAVLRALNGSAVTARTFAGVAENNMSDAVLRALNGKFDPSDH